MNDRTGYWLLFFLVIAVVASIVLGVNSYQIKKDITGWKDLAQVSLNPNDMLEYMSKVKLEMENRNMTYGYAAIIFTTPDKNMALIYKAVTEHVDQAEILVEMDPSSQEYQSGMDNIRGSIRELDIHAFSFWSVHAGFIWTLLAWVGWILFFATLVIWQP